MGFHFLFNIYISIESQKWKSSVFYLVVFLWESEHVYSSVQYGHNFLTLAFISLQYPFRATVSTSCLNF